jgi:hypothetical protein
MSEMKRKMIPVEEAFAEWREDPEYVKAYDTLEAEFALAGGRTLQFATAAHQVVTLQNSD